MTTRPLEDREINLLFELEAQIPGLRQTLELARLIATAPATARSRHPVLNFALLRAPGSVIDNLLLRCFEAVPLIDRANRQYSLPGLLTKARDPVPEDPDLALAYRLRHEVVAHRVKLAPRGFDALTALRDAHTDVFTLLSTVLDRLASALANLRQQGIFDRVVDPTVVEEPVPFAAEDIESLIDAANAVSLRADSPGPL